MSEGPRRIEINRSDAVRHIPRGIPQRPTEFPKDAAPKSEKKSHKARNLVVGTSVVAAASVAAGALSGAFGGRNNEPNPTQPGGIIEPGTSPHGSGPILTPDGTAVITFPPTESPRTPEPSPELTETPSLPPLNEPSPSPTPIVYATPWHATPTPEVRNFSSFVELVNAYATFDEGGELKNQSGDFQINYSRDLLNGAGIASVSLNSRAMEETRNIIANETYGAVHEPKNSHIRLGSNREDDSITAPVVNIVSLGVTPEQYDSILFTLQNNNLKYFETGYVDVHWILAFEGNKLYHIAKPDRSNTLYNTPENWDRKDVGLRFANEFGYTYFDISTSALMGAGDEFKTLKTEPVAEPLGLNEKNDYGANGEKGEFEIEFK